MWELKAELTNASGAIYDTGEARVAVEALVGSFFFLRLICPSIVSSVLRIRLLHLYSPWILQVTPRLLQDEENPLSPVAVRGLVLVAKVITNSCYSCFAGFLLTLFIRFCNLLPTPHLTSKYVLFC